MTWCQRLPFPSKEPSQFWGPTSSELLSLTWELKCALRGHLKFEFNIPHTLTFHLGDVKFANAFYFMYLFMSHNLWHNGGVMKTPCQPWSQSLLCFQLCLLHISYQLDIEGGQCLKLGTKHSKVFPLHLKASSPHKRCFHQLERPSTICLQTQPFAIQIKKPFILLSLRKLAPMGLPQSFGPTPLDHHLWGYNPHFKGCPWEQGSFIFTYWFPYSHFTIFVHGQ